jgi:hypothetical protein
VAALTPLVGYFDASGHPNQGTVLVVGGFISFEARWLQFESRWNKTLREAGVTCFHMSEFINRKNEFAGWNQRKREHFLATLGHIIIDSVVCNFGSTIVLADWNKANQEYELAECDFQPYALAGWSCVQRVFGWCEGHGYKNPLFFFEHGDKHQCNLLRRVEQDFGVSVRTALKKPDKRKPNELPLVQLQSADFAAWQILNLMSQHQAGNRTRRSVETAIEPWLWKMFNKLFGALPYENSHFSLESFSVRGPSLIRLCDEYGVARRAQRN